MKRPILIIIFIFLIIIHLVSCKVSSDNEDKIKNTIIGYFESLETHNLNEIKKYRPDFDERLKSSVVDVVLDCNLISIDFDKVNKINDNIIEVPVKYEIVYSDKYIPIGFRDIGENDIYEIFTLKDYGDYYVIKNMVNPYLE